MKFLLLLACLSGLVFSECAKEMENIIPESNTNFLVPFIVFGSGVSFKADNGKYWSVIQRGNIGDIEAAKPIKDVFTKFTIENIDCKTIYLRAVNGKYLSRIHRSGVDYIEPIKGKPDAKCRFTVYNYGAQIVLRADNGRYLSRIYRNGRDNIEAMKDDVDVSCKFFVETA